MPLCSVKRGKRGEEEKRRDRGGKDDRKRGEEKMRKLKLVAILSV
jgi:hypothetical protein